MAYMKNTINCFFGLSLTALISSCGNTGETSQHDTPGTRFAKLEQVKWLLGEWQNSSQEGNASEMWEQSDDSTYRGKSYFIAGKDTVSSETLILVQRGEDLFYIPTVKGQNDDQPVEFKLVSSKGKQIVFENLKHDFPQKITYTQITNDSLIAEISGNMDGKVNTMNFPMKRRK